MDDLTYGHLEEQLKLLLKNRIVLQCCLFTWETDVLPSQQIVDCLKRSTSLIDCWVEILNEYERFTIHMHLTCHKSWPLVAESFEKVFGLQQARSERTLRTYQKNGLEKIIICFSNQILAVRSSIPDCCIVY